MSRYDGHQDRGSHAWNLHGPMVLLSSSGPALLTPQVLIPGDGRTVMGAANPEVTHIAPVRICLVPNMLERYYLAL